MAQWFTAVCYNIGNQTSPHKERAVTCVVDARSFGEARQTAVSIVVAERRRHPNPNRRQVRINRVGITAL